MPLVRRQEAGGLRRLCRVIFEQVGRNICGVNSGLFEITKNSPAGQESNTSSNRGRWRLACGISPFGCPIASAETIGEGRTEEYGIWVATECISRNTINLWQPACRMFGS